MDEKGRFDLRYRTLTPEHDMREIEGYLEELLDPQFYETQKIDDYLKITLLDEGALPIQSGSFVKFIQMSFTWNEKFISGT